MKTTVFLFLSMITVIIAMMHTSGRSPVVSDSDKPAVSFANDVYPIIEEHCLPCHLQEERNMSRLFMDNYELLMEGGFNGPPIEPGNADESLLIKKISPEPPFGERMPMRGEEYLNDDEIEIIARWINEGAEDN